ncbi:hypothetical protein [Roseicyclus persicicus]|uniref:Uncharacterized protein n=1 Tax=Roseicyclus persicicus TaxID=2650661 RepID=A0A7X6H1Y7_9RHOB|nr:hypothetical protein [Roseibacterium persicicum]NKX45859.1 hypothetical protein [Roseibacterium persicicum]
MPVPQTTAAALTALLCLGAPLVATPAAAQLYDPCPWTGDGECDEPNGLNLCAWGTDTADCSNPNSYFGSGSGYSPGSSVPGGGAGAGATAGGGAPAAGGGITTYFPWRTFDRQMGQFAGQPANSSPLTPMGNMHYQPGSYTVYTSIVQNGQRQQVEAYSVTMQPNERYLAAASSMGHLSFSTDARLITYSPPAPGMAMVYGRNDDVTYDRAICILPAGWPMAQCGP